MRSALLLLVIAQQAHADPLPRLDVGAGTAVPLTVGVEAGVGLSDRLGLEVGVGLMPPPYVDLINAAVVALDGYDETTASLIAAALDNAIIGRISFAVAPWQRWPLSLHAGYSLVALGGGLGAGVAIEAVTGMEVRAEAAEEVPISSRVHFIQLGAAWRFDLTPSLLLRVALEYTQPIASSSSIDAAARTPRGKETIARASAALDTYLDDVYTSYVKSPVIGVSLRWRLR